MRGPCPKGEIVMMEIRVGDKEEMVDIVCFLVKKGFSFTADFCNKRYLWVITLRLLH